MRHIKRSFRIAALSSALSPAAVTAHIYIFSRATTQAAAATVQGSATQPAATQPASRGELPWLTTYADAIDESRRTGQPIIVDVGADWCVWCRQLDEQIAAEPVQQKLQHWTLLRLNVDRDVDAVRSLAVGPIPALRILSPDGQVIAWHNGYMKADELAAWIGAHAPLSDVEKRGVLEASGSPDAAALKQILAQLTDRDPLLREAAVQRLTPFPNVAAEQVTAVFAGGKLRERLAAREVLAAWKAPVDGLDPWKPLSINEQSLAALKKWAGQKHQAPTAPDSLAPADAAIARHDIAAMLQTTDPTDVASARERLARFGPALLPQIYAALKTAATDQDKERLTALRYRAVATEARALQWPGGFDRLASIDAQVRHQAVDELGKSVTAADSPLLLELFIDPDPFVREASLRLMQTAGGGVIPTGMARLLGDPEPNVRAAVLKQLAQTPDARMAPQVVKYLATEKDPDLIVHAIRYLREARGPVALNCLRSLLSHPSWRVRAEAAEGLGKFVEGYAAQASVPPQEKADIYAAMIKLLKDPDGFVASRALAVLKDANMPAADAAMVDLAKRHPEMAGEVVKVLGAQSRDAAAQQALKTFLNYSDPAVRAAAITAGALGGDTNRFAGLLGDPSSRVRIATAKVVEETLDSLRPQNRTIEVPAKLRDWEAWLSDFQSLKGRPAWAGQAMEPLRKMFASDDPREKIAAVFPLVALGDDRAAKSLSQLAAGLPDERRHVTSALRWLHWDARLALFKQLRNGADARMLGTLAQEMAAAPHPKLPGMLWDLLKEPAADVSVTAEVERSINAAYTGESYMSLQPGMVDEEQRKSLVDTAKQMAAHGAANQRLAALALLLSASPPDAGAAAGDLLASGAGGEGLHAASLQILLLSQTREDGVKTAIPRLSDTPAMRKIAVAYLAAGQAALGMIEGQIYLNYYNPGLQFRTFMQGQPVEIKPPPGLTIGMLNPLLSDSDPEVAGYAGYLMCILGDRRGLDPLLRVWQTNHDDDTWRRLTYRSIAVVNDDNLTPTLADLYATFQKGDFQINDFYWTIQIIKGPQISKLRKRIHDEIGADTLR